MGGRSKNFAIFCVTPCYTHLMRFKNQNNHRYWGGAGLLWGFINPRNFHFYCIFGPLFWPVGFHQGQNFSKIFEQSSKIFEKSTIFRKKGQFLPFFPKTHFLGSKHCFFKISAPSATKC